MKMRKIVAALMAVLMLCCLIPFAAVADDASAVIDFTDKANRTHYSTEQQIWEQNGITITNDKGASTSNVGDYGGEGYPARFYKSSTVKIEYPGMTKIVIDCTSLDAKYVNGWADSFSANATASVENNIVTIELAEAADSFVWEKMSAQSRAYNITVYGAAAEPEVPAVPVSYEADFDTIVTDKATGDSSYNKTFTTESGWVTENSAIQTGGASVMNPQFPVIGEDNSSKAVCMNGKVSAPGKISSPVLSGGINKLTINYTKMFTDTKLSATITITDVATGAVYTNTFSREEDKNTKYEIWTYEWVLETPIAGDFKIEIANDCPSQATGNKDRLTVLDVIWETMGSGSVTPDVPACEHEYDDEYDADCNKCGETREVPEKPVEPDVPASDLILIDAPKAGVAYKFGMIQGNVSATDVYYLKGGMNGYYMDTAADASAAIDVYLEETAGGYYMYAMVDGAKTYINMVVSGTHVNGAYEASASTVYTFNADSKTVIAIVNDTEYWFGTRNDKQYTTVGPCAVSYAGFYCQFYGAAETPDAPVVPDEPDVPVEPDVPASDLILIDAPKAGVAYKFGMIQGNVSATDVYYLKGGMNGYYMDTAADASAAIDVYLEETAGGYYMYAMVDGAKTYINMVVSGTHVNGAYEASASTVYTFNADSKTVIAIVNDTEYWFGTRNDKQYTTVGPCAVSYAGFYCQFYGAAETPDAPVEPDEPEVPSDPAADSVLTIPQANELGLSKEKNTYTVGKYYVTGKIVAISNSTYGNMYIVDENNNQFMVYGAYSADGEIRFDALEYIPVVGDTVTVYGIIGTYNGTEAQMKNGWITEIVKGEGEPENTDPAADSVLTVKEAIELGLSKLHNVFTENKYYVTAEIAEIYNDIYGNMYVKDAEGNVLTIYGTYDADGTNRFDAMENKPVVGDTVKLYGIVGQYNGNPQMKNAWIVAINPTDEPVDPEEPSDPSDPEEPSEPDAPVTPDEPGTDAPVTGDNSTVYVTLAVVLMALAAVAAFVTSKKRA